MKHLALLSVETIRLMLAISAGKDLEVHQLDIKTAFLNGEIGEEIYIEQPEGFVVPGKEKLGCKLKKSLYGLKHSPRCWNTTLGSHLERIGFKQSSIDPCLYHVDNRMFIAVYVDDILLAGRAKDLEMVKRQIASRFEVVDGGPIKHLLGINVVQNKDAGTIWIGQSTFCEDLLRRHGFKDCKPVDNPVALETKLVTNKGEPVNTEGYRSIVGGLLYLSTRTRPDIAFAVGAVARHCSSPGTEHWIAVKRIMRYLCRTKDFGIEYRHSSTISLVGYSDADWAGDLDDRKSTSGYIFKLSGGAVSWSQKQSSVALSTVEAKYMALSSASQECIWLRNVLSDLGQSSTSPTVVYEDNQPAISLAHNPEFHGRPKHMDIRYHFTREQVEKKSMRLEYCPTEEMIADVLTKGLSKHRFEKLRGACGVNQNINSVSFGICNEGRC